MIVTEAWYFPVQGMILLIVTKMVPLLSLRVRFTEYDRCVNVCSL